MNRTVLKSVFRRTAALALAVVMSVPTVFAHAGETRLHSSTELVEGLTYHNTVTENHSRRVESFSLELAPGSKAYPIMVQGSGTAYGAANIKTAVANARAQGYHVLGAVNSDFFVMSTGVPMGISVENGVYKSSNTTEDAVVFGYDGSISLVSQPKVALTMTNTRTGSVFSPSHFNKARNTLGGVYLMNRDFADTTRAKSMGWNVRLKLVETSSGIFDPTTTYDPSLRVNSSLTLQVVELVETDQPLTIAPDEYILTCDPASHRREVFESFQVGDQVVLTASCTDPVLSAAQWAGGVGDVMIRDGAITDSSKWTYIKDGRAPRTAMGVKADGTLLVYAVDGRKSDYSNGLGQLDLAEEMLRQGCRWAVNLDGGGSTALSVWQPGQSGTQLVSRPSDGSPRRCATYLMLVTDDKGDGQPDRLAFRQSDDLVVLAGSSVKLPDIAVLDSGLNIIDRDPGQVSITSEAGLGTVNEGVYTAGSTAGVDTLRLHSPSLGVDGPVNIQVVDHLTELKVTHKGHTTPVTSLSAKPGEQLPLAVTGSYWGRTALHEPSSVTWSVTGGVGSVDENALFTVGENPGKGTVTAVVGGLTHKISFAPINVHTDVPEGHWAYDAVEFCYRQGVTSGISATQFGPDLPITRADFVVMIHNAMGKPAPSVKADFADVAPTDYYFNAISWAREKGLISGTAPGVFSPKDLILREQAFSILRNTLPVLGKIVPDASLSVLDQFPDKNTISDWAKPAAATLAAQGIISGGTSGAAPLVPLNRASMAVMLHKIMTYTPITDVPVDPKPQDPTLPQLTLDRAQVQLASGDSLTLKAALTPAVEGAEITWRSSSPSSVAVSEDGVITNLFAGVGAPVVTVTAAWKGQTASCQVTVGAPKRTGTVIDAEDGLRVRSGPGTSYDIMGGLSNHTRVLILDEADGWYHIMYLTRSNHAATGYVSGDYISINK